MFKHKQHAIQNALLVGHQIAQRKRRSVVTAAIATWRQEARISTKLKSLRQSRSAHVAGSCLIMWRHYAEISVR